MRRKLVATTAVVLFGALAGSALAQSTTTYGYDAQGRLISASRSNTATSYDYDKAGNRAQVVITGGNTPPVAASDTAAVTAGSTISISALANDSDADSDALTITQVTGATKGTALVINGGLNISYAANTGTSGTETLTYTIADSKGATAQGTITITISAVVAPPTVGAATTLITANTSNNPLTTNITGSATSVSVTQSPTNGVANPTGTTINYTPNTNWAGVDTLQYKATNAGGMSPSAATLTVQVKPIVNAVSSVAVTYNTAKAITLAPVTNYNSLNVAGAPSKGTVSISGTTATYTPNSGQSGADSFTYTATAAGIVSASKTVSLTISSPPAAPTVGPATTTITANTSSNALTTAIGGAATSVSVTAAPANGTTSVSGTTIYYTPSTNWSGSNTLNYTATGTGGTSAAATLTVLVKPIVNAVSSVAVTYNTPKAISLAPVTNYSSLAVSSSPTKGSVSISGATATYTPNSGQTGADSFAYTATTAGGTSAAKTVSLTISSPPANTAPVANGDLLDTLTAYSSDYAYVLANDTDANGDTLTITGLSTTETTRAYYTIVGNAIEVVSKGPRGTETISYTISDGNGGTATATLRIVVNL